MTKQFFITLAVALLGFIATKAQAPFTGRVEYEFIFQEEVPQEQPRMILEYRPRYLKLIAFALKDTITGLYEPETEMVIDYISGKTYQVSHDAKKIISLEKTKTTLVLPQLTQLPGEQTIIAGNKANLYQTKIDKFQSYRIWFADSITVTQNDVLAQNSDFFIFGTGKLLLRVEPDTIGGKKKKGEDVTINAVKITPLTFSDSSYQLPANYAIEDEAALNRLQDSLLRQFQNVDSVLAQQKLNQDSAKWAADEINSYVNKKPTSPKKPTKKPAKKPAAKSTAYRKQ